MKKNVVFVLALVSSVLGLAQNNAEPKYLLTTKAITYGLSVPVVEDPYLSPMSYSGFGVNFLKESSRYFSVNNTNYSSQDKLALSGGIMLNPTHTSEMTYLGINYGWGANYHIRVGNQLRILAGGLWDVDFGFKNVSRNVNNPVNLDMATNLNLTGLLVYDYPTRRRVLHYRVLFQAPIMGYMFVPPGGASYYDMFELGSLSQAFHFSSLHNRLGLNQTYSVDVPFNRTTWRFGLRFQNLRYKANDLVFDRNETSLIIGTTFDAISFAGKKKTAPKNFLSTNY